MLYLPNSKHTKSSSRTFAQNLGRHTNADQHTTRKSHNVEAAAQPAHKHYTTINVCLCVFGQSALFGESCHPCIRQKECLSITDGCRGAFTNIRKRIHSVLVASSMANHATRCVRAVFCIPMKKWGGFW